jgi:transposase
MHLANQVDFVIGVDTHKNSHTLGLIDRTGVEVADTMLVTDAFGYRKMLAWVRERTTDPERRCWAVEGTGSFGAGLTTYLLEQGEWVVEIDRPARRPRNGAKSDVIDAYRAAREALARNHVAQPRRRGTREAIRVLLTTREGAVRARSRALCHLQALVVNAPAQLRDQLRRDKLEVLVERCARLRIMANHSVEHRATIRALRATARRIQTLTAEADDLEAELELLVSDTAPELLAEPGVGAISAAQILNAWSHPGRIRSEAAFAMLSGTAPIPASSGQTIRYRLNRSGDRQLNRALHTIVLSRMRFHPETKAYVARRLSEGRTPREIKRCLKRYVARRLFRLLESSQPSEHITIPEAA